MPGPIEPPPAENPEGEPSTARMRARDPHHPGRRIRFGFSRARREMSTEPEPTLWPLPPRIRDQNPALPWRFWLSVLVGLAAAVWFATTVSFGAICVDEYGFRCPPGAIGSWASGIGWGMLVAAALYLVMELLAMGVDRFRGGRD